MAKTEKVESRPTLVPMNPFHADDDAQKLHRAMKGFGTDEEAIISVLTKRSKKQRQTIATEYRAMFGRDLLLDLKSETSGRFKDILVAMMTPPPMFWATELHYAVAGLGTDEEALIEIMTSLSNSEIQAVKQVYAKRYCRLLETDLSGDTSGDFRKLLLVLAMGNRSEDLNVNEKQAWEDANNLRAGKASIDKVFQIMCSRSLPQLVAIFEEYRKITGYDIDEAIKDKCSWHTKNTLHAIVQLARNKTAFYAERLHKSMKGLGTNDRQLIRIMVTRCEIDLQDIADLFAIKYEDSLQNWITDDCSGDYKKCLLGLLNSNKDS